MLKAQSKAVLDIFYRLLSSPIDADDINGTIPAANLPGSVTGDLDGARIMDGTITQAKLGSDVSMIKKVQRPTVADIAGGATVSILIDEVNLDKAFVVASFELGQGIASLPDSTHVSLTNGNGNPSKCRVEVIEFL